MSNHRLKYLKNEAIEDVTANRIQAYEAKAGVNSQLPVPIEKIVEQVLQLDFEWDEIEEQPGEQILGGLIAAERKIVLNEKHLALFEAKPGLERSTIGHEAGHWDIDIDRAYRLYKKITEGQDSPEVRSAVDRYQSALLMPAWLMRQTDKRYDLTKWPELYRLAEEAQVNISNLTVRLQRLGLIYLRDGDKKIYRNQDEVTGQGSLF